MIFNCKSIEKYIRSVNRPDSLTFDKLNTYQQERIKRQVEKDLARINSNEYQTNLKAWAQGSSKHFLNDDNTPKMVDGFYWSDKRFFDKDFLKRLGYTQEEAQSAHKEFLENLKETKTPTALKEFLHREHLGG